MDQHIPWLLQRDCDLIIHVSGDGTKTPTCVANLACSAMGDQGITEVTVCDHGLEQVVGEDVCCLAHDMLAGRISESSLSRVLSCACWSF